MSLIVFVLLVSFNKGLIGEVLGFNVLYFRFLCINIAGVDT